MKFQVNQKVIALSSSAHPLSQSRIKGNVYAVTALSWCSRCGANLININNSPSRNRVGTGTFGCNCGNIQPNRGLGWTYSHHFASLTEESMEALAESEEYELAAIVRDNLTLQNH